MLFRFPALEGLVVSSLQNLPPWGSVSLIWSPSSFWSTLLFSDPIREVDMVRGREVDVDQCGSPALG